MIRDVCGVQQFTFVLNHNDHAVEISLPEPAHDLLGGQVVTGALVLGGFGAAILVDQDGTGK